MPSQKTLPTTAASCSSRFCSSGNASRRAAMIPWTVSGSRSSSPDSRSASIRTYCSAYSGFPPARSSSSACVSAGSKGRSLKAEISVAVSSAVSGDSATVAAFTLPPPQAGRRSSSSSRAVQRISIGTSCTQSTRYSMKSSRPSSAHWMSSNTSTMDRCSASASKKRRHAANASSGDDGARSLASPTSGRR